MRTPNTNLAPADIRRSLRPSRRPTLAVLAAASVAVVALLASGCAGGEADDEAAGSTSTTTAAPSCDQGATVDEVAVEPVAGVDSDHTITSFDGTEIRIHWFPTDQTDGEPAPTVLMGPGWSLAGDTSQDGAELFGALGIGPLNDTGYNVLTWDPRGFGESTGAASVNDPELEGRDTQILLDWVAEQPESQLDADGDPRVGMAGFSYGGGIQLTLAGLDCRVDAIVPGLAWNTLEKPLYRNETVKTGWAGVLSDAASTGTVDPHVTSAQASGEETGTLSEEDHEWFLGRGPGDLVDQIRVPTLLIQGTVDTLFSLDEAVTNYQILQGNDVPTGMLWFCGGHGTCLTETGDETRVAARTFAWLDRYLKGDSSVDVGSTLELVDQDGTTWTASEFPLDTGDALTATGDGTLQLVEEGGANLVQPPGDELLDGLVSDITPGRATNAVDLQIAAPDDGVMILGAPMLTLTYRGTVPDGERPTRVFAQLVDDERNVVVGNQITPVAVELDGETHTLQVPLETIVQHLEPGQTLTLQLVAVTNAYATPRLGGEVTFEQIEIAVPTVTGLDRQD